MAHVRAPLLSLEARGHVGDLVYESQTPSGPRVARLAKPTSLPTTRQTAQRDRVAYAMALWRVRDSWWMNGNTARDLLWQRPATWSLYNLFLHEVIENANTAKTWDTPIVTGIDILVPSTLAVYISHAWGPAPPTLLWGYSPDRLNHANIGFDAPWHGGDYGMNTSLPTPGSTLWWSVASAATWPVTGSTVPAPIYIP